MELSLKHTVSVVAWLLVAAAVTQAVYTGMYAAEMTPPRQLLWGTEGFLFVMLGAFAGAAMAQAKGLHLAWSAILGAAILNVVQVGVGLTMFGPFREVAEAVPEAAPAASGVVAFSFMVYNAAKVLLALALIVVGLARASEGAKALGWISAVVGAFALVTNALSMAMGRDFAGELPLAGGSGVLATALLAACLFTLSFGDDT